MDGSEHRSGDGDTWYSPPTNSGGARWIQRVVVGDSGSMSQLGRAAADLLGDLFSGIYHLDESKLHDADWSSESCVSVLVDGVMATVNNDLLTRLVWLSHLYRLRVETRPHHYNYVKMTISRHTAGMTDIMKKIEKLEVVYGKQ